jgi:hypothetical protein
MSRTLRTSARAHIKQTKWKGASLTLDALEFFTSVGTFLVDENLQGAHHASIVEHGAQDSGAAVVVLALTAARSAFGRVRCLRDSTARGPCASRLCRTIHRERSRRRRRTECRQRKQCYEDERAATTKQPRLLGRSCSVCNASKTGSAACRPWRAP